jgi:hypothetical protein
VPQDFTAGRIERKEPSARCGFGAIQIGERRKCHAFMRRHTPQNPTQLAARSDARLPYDLAPAIKSNP